MARPRKEGMDYFPHDTDATNDEKIEALRALYGNDGYAFYFILLERIYNDKGAEFDVSNPAILASLIAKVGVGKERFFEILETAFSLKCFDRETYRERNVITSNAIKRRASEVKNLRERQRNNKNTSGVLPEKTGEETKEVTKEETGESKAKQSKTNKSKAASNVQPEEPESPQEEPKPAAVDSENTLKSLDDFACETLEKVCTSPLEKQAMQQMLEAVGGDLDLIRRKVLEIKDTYKPQYEGDRIKTFKYFLGGVLEEVARQKARAEPIPIDKNRQRPREPDTDKVLEMYYRKAAEI
jgi:hypothetical protein